MSSIAQDLRFGLHVITHPLDGFWDMKHENRGRLWVAIAGIVSMALTSVFSKETTAFLFGGSAIPKTDLITEFTKVLILFLLVCVANWSVTTLLDGEGTFKDIVMTFGYSCLPVTLINIPKALLTNVCTYSESAYIGLMSAAAIIWFIGLLFFGLMTVHQYSFGKMLLTTVATIAAAAVLTFVYLLFFSLITQMGTFIATVIREISFRTR